MKSKQLMQGPVPIGTVSGGASLTVVHSALRGVRD